MNVSTSSFVLFNLITVVSKVLNRNLVWSEAEKSFFFTPVGKAPTKTAKSRRMKRSFFVSRKALSTEWSVELLAFMKNHYAVLMESLGLPEDGPVLKPPAREGLQEKAIFMGIDYTTFRRGVDMVVQDTSTNTRGAVETYLMKDKSLVSQPHQAQSY